MHNTVVCYIVFICIYFLHWICGELHYFCCVICIAFGVMFFIFLVNKPFYSQLPIGSILYILRLQTRRVHLVLAATCTVDFIQDS